MGVVLSHDGRRIVGAEQANARRASHRNRDAWAGGGAEGPNPLQIEAVIGRPCADRAGARGAGRPVVALAAVAPVGGGRAGWVPTVAPIGRDLYTSNLANSVAGCTRDGDPSGSASGWPR